MPAPDGIGINIFFFHLPRDNLVVSLRLRRNSYAYCLKTNSKRNSKGKNYTFLKNGTFQSRNNSATDFTLNFLPILRSDFQLKSFYDDNRFNTYFAKNSLHFCRSYTNRAKQMYTKLNISSGPTSILT